MDIVATLLGTLAGAALDLLHQDLTPRALVLAVALGLVVAGHVDRRVERARFHITLRLHGFDSHSEYVASRFWKTRRRHWLATQGRRPCRICAKTWRDGPDFHAHHLDYFRAGVGHESNRDLVPICSSCHTLVHRADRHLRTLGVSLRRCTGLVAAVAWPVRVWRRATAETTGVTR
jgi:hypothetical protein